MLLLYHFKISTFHCLLSLYYSSVPSFHFVLQDQSPQEGQ